MDTDLEEWSNRKLSAEIQRLLTDGAKEMLGDDLLLRTKPWRAELWKLFKEVDVRICPTPENQRKRNR
ncbi:hypothetical protein CC53_gp163 [Rhizobium phage vB_RleS_L338C]|uniref:hypothetical protein n=1 Tax=Rhizobium phage vB_RleS_L338C TaxID=1414737 RepID=UPI0003D93857|nr:hypothetical protein CC53_gp163 [Rhizobium phage vB_RleS_L338C]AHC30580.1 hypothetical protein L338C_163 [Rhizobium phage vB_RleS_L338C]QNH72181.1 hypothetical protein P11VFA_156 [Rhizobium phage P11VFA]